MNFPDLQEYAMTYLARYNNTEKGLLRVLKAKLRRWSIKAEQEGMEHTEIESKLQRGYQEISDVLVKVKRLGFVNDQTFTEYKVEAYIRTGRSQKVMQNKLLQKGVGFDIVQSVLDQYQDTNFELFAALVYARKKHIGPFRRIDRAINAEIKQKEQLSFARGGFSYAMTNQILSMDRAEAEEMILSFRTL